LAPYEITEEEERIRDRRNRTFALAMLAVLLGMIVMHRLLFAPSRKWENLPQMAATTPGMIDMAYNPFRIEYPDGDSVFAWYIPRREIYDNANDPFLALFNWFSGDDTSIVKPGGTVIVLGDGQRDKSAYLNHAALFHRMGYTVCLFDYRGVGESKGEASLPNALEDAMKTIQETRAKSRGDRFALYGLGLGANLAIEIAARLEAEQKETIRGGIGDSPLASPGWFYRDGREQHYGRLLGSLIARWKPLPDEPRSTEEALEALNLTPVLFVEGEKEDPASSFASKFYLAKEGPRDYWRVPRTGFGQEIDLFPLEASAQFNQFLAPLLLENQPQWEPIEKRIVKTEEGSQELRLTLAPSVINAQAGKNPVAVEVSLLTGETWTTERHWLDPGAPSLAYRMEQPPQIVSARLYRFPELIEVRSASDVVKSFALSRCDTRQHYSSRMQDFGQRKDRLRQLYEFARVNLVNPADPTQAGPLQRAQENLAREELFQACENLHRLVREMQPAAVFDPNRPSAGAMIGLIEGENTPEDGHPVWTDIKGRKAVSTRVEQGQCRLYFDIDDAALRDIPLQLIGLEIEYLANGEDWFQCLYDSHDPLAPETNGEEKPTRYEAKSGSGQWRKTLFLLGDARFANRGWGFSDFCLSAADDRFEPVNEVIASIRVYDFSVGKN
jgi:pimeloyl-ACP methyl ester carboxylesterase